MIATPPSSRGGSQSSLTVTLSVVFRVYCKLTGGEGGPVQCQMEEENGVLAILGQVKHYEWKCHVTFHAFKRAESCPTVPS